MSSAMTRQFAWLQQNRRDIEMLYILVKDFLENSPRAILDNLKFDTFLEFVLENSTRAPSRRLPLTDVDDYGAAMNGTDHFDFTAAIPRNA